MSILYAARQQSDSPVEQHEKMKVLGYFALRPDLAGELSAPMHRTDKLPVIIWPFRAVQKAAPTSMTGLTYGLAVSASPYLFHKSKLQSSCQATDDRKEKKGGPKKKKISTVDKRASRRWAILTAATETAKRKRLQSRRNCGLAASYT